MLGKTHFAVGVAVTMAVTRPASISELILAIGCGGMGALISDIDVDTSESHHEADRITILAMGVVLSFFLFDYFVYPGLVEQVIKDSGYMQIITGTLLFIGICAFGKEQPHRSFMHSFFALVLLSFAMRLVWEKMVIYFVIGFLCHLALDIFNKKKVRLFYPLKKGVAFRLCTAGGLVNHILFGIGNVLLVLEFFLSVLRIFGR